MDVFSGATSDLTRLVQSGGGDSVTRVDGDSKERQDNDRQGSQNSPSTSHTSIVCPLRTSRILALDCAQAAVLLGCAMIVGHLPLLPGLADPLML